MKEDCAWKHITTNTTTVFSNVSAYVEQIAFCADASGTGGWLFKVQDRGDTLTPPVPVQTLVKVVLATPSTPDQQKVFFDRPIPMRGGVKVVTESGTPGIVDIWITGFVSEEQT